MSLFSTFTRSAARALPAFSNAPRVVAARRAIHSVPPLDNIEVFSAKGVPGAMSQKAFNTSWTEYQQHLVDNLNRLTAGTELENKTPLDIAVMTSRQADQAATFNYASQAHNNHFFFQSLAPEETKMPEQLAQMIPYTWSSQEAFKTEFLATANAMFGPGWVWLVLDQGKHLRILCTYNAGTPYGEAHRRQDIDMNTRQRLGTQAPGLPEIGKGTYHQSMNTWALPLMNIKVWEHAWLQDYGVAGKKEYLENVWKAIDWKVVNSRFPHRESHRQMFSS